MLNTWLRLFGDAQRLPAIEQFQFDRIEDERPDLVYFEVEYETGEPRFKVGVAKANTLTRFSVQSSQA